MATLVDTSALLALLSAGDDHHARATATLADLRGREALVTHNYVSVEASALVQRRLGSEAVLRLHDRLLPPLKLLWIDERIHRAAEGALLAAGRSDVSLVDWVSFEVMRRHGISKAFAFDRDFAAQGFSLVP